MDTHGHHHKERKQIVNRLARIEGHVRAVKEMANDERDCPEILLQIAAIQKALDSVAKVIFSDHLKQCIAPAISEDQREKVLDDLKSALENYIK